MIQAIALFNGTDDNSVALPSQEKTLTSGRKTIGFISKKAYGQQFGLKGNELRRAHDRYRNDFGVAGNVGLTGMISSGQVLLQKVSETKDGFNARFVRASVLDLGTDPKAEAAKLTDEELLAIINARKEAAK